MARKKQQKKKSDPEEFVCEFCSKTYKSKSGLRRHEKKCPEKDSVPDSSEEEPLAIEDELEALPVEPDEEENDDEGAMATAAGGMELDIESQLDVRGPDATLGGFDEASGDVASLKGQLEGELLRLQEEYKRQKDETEKLQRERAALQREREGLDSIIIEKIEAEKQKLLHDYVNGSAEAPPPRNEYPGETAEAFDEPAHFEGPEPQQPPETYEEPLDETPSQEVPAQTDWESTPSEPEPDLDEPEAGYEEPGTDYSDYETTPSDDDHDPDYVDASPGASVDFERVPAGLSTKLQDIESQYADQATTLSHVTQELSGLRSSVDIVSSTNLTAKIENIMTKFKRIEEDFKKQSDKINNIISEIGIGEVIDVSKVPPDILEGVYEATLNDIVEQMRGHIGASGLDRVISEILESIRMQTSGSELFYFDGKKVRTRKLAGYIERKLISARQVQTTYETFVKRLIEYTHNYQPKNFKAMVSIKSQEYAVNNSRLFRDEIDTISEGLDSLRSDIYRLEDLLNEKINVYSTELEERFGNLEAEVSSLQNADLMFTNDIRKMLEKFEGEDVSLESLIEMNRNLADRMTDFENAQNINVARFSAIERRILDEGEDISDLGVDVEASILKKIEDEDVIQIKVDEADEEETGAAEGLPGEKETADAEDDGEEEAADAEDTEEEEAADAVEAGEDETLEEIGELEKETAPEGDGSDEGETTEEAAQEQEHSLSQDLIDGMPDEEVENPETNLEPDKTFDFSQGTLVLGDDEEPDDTSSLSDEEMAGADDDDDKDDDHSVPADEDAAADPEDDGDDEEGDATKDEDGDDGGYPADDEEEDDEGIVTSFGFAADDSVPAEEAVEEGEEPDDGSEEAGGDEEPDEAPGVQVLDEADLAEHEPEGEPEMEETTPIIQGLINEGFDSRTKIEKALKNREIKMSRAEVEEAIQDLVDSDLVEAVKKGRYYKYLPKEE